MSTIDKALSILDLFSESQPTLRLSDIARRMNWDKSNVQRYVSDLTARGLLEQDPTSRAYCLGASLTRLAMVRARTNPIAAEVDKTLRQLVKETGETAHASRLVGDRLMTTAIEETNYRGTRVYIDEADPLPLHASGSGVALLATLPDKRIEQLLTGALKAFTPQTPTDLIATRALIEKARANGYVKMSGTYERDVIGLGAAVVSYEGEGVGAIAVAIPAARFAADQEATIARAVVKAAGRVSRLYGAEMMAIA